MRLEPVKLKFGKGENKGYGDYRVSWERDGKDFLIEYNNLTMATDWFDYLERKEIPVTMEKKTNDQWVMHRQYNTTTGKQETTRNT